MNDNDALKLVFDVSNSNTLQNSLQILIHISNSDSLHLSPYFTHKPIFVFQASQKP
ncbi:hypothetical protein RYX36_023163, partial [Vicia faba]